MVAIDVVILTWNDGELLERAVRSVLESKGADASVIVVDNGSTPPATVVDGVQLIRNDLNRGVAPARNQGVRVGEAPYVCLLDSDAELTPPALAMMIETLDRDADIALVAPVFVGQLPSAGAGPKYTFFDKVQRALNLRDTYPEGRGFVDGVRDVDFAIGACQVFRRSAFDQVAGLDETYFYGPEDVDFCLRLRGRGLRSVQLEAALVHHPPRRRNRRLFTRRGMRHARAVCRHLCRHRRFKSGVAT